MDIQNAIADLSVRIFQKAVEKPGNMLVSPIAAISALSAILRGASGSTKAQLEEQGITPDGLAPILEAFQDERSCAELATVIWMNDRQGLTFNENRIQEIAADPNSEVFQTADLEQARGQINDWCNQKTKGMIPEMVDQLAPNELMRLVNALVFDGKWCYAYQPCNVYDRTFTNIRGEKQDIPFLHSTESLFLRDRNATGFMKPYLGGQYAFAALLPNEGISLEDYIRTLTGQRLQRILRHPLSHEVLTAMPKFSARSDVDLKAIFRDLGVTDAFDMANADFSNLCHSDDPDTSLYLESFRQKGYIDVNERGTQALALTGIETLCLTSSAKPEPYRVYLDRPFLYMIVDQRSHLPLFMGTIHTI